MAVASSLPLLLMILVTTFFGVAPTTAHSLEALPRFAPLQWQAQLVSSKPKAKDATPEPFTKHYFPQELDHFTFTPNSSSIFYQKYLMNATFWNSTGCGRGAAPIFVYAGSEADIEWIAANAGFMFDIGPKFGALLVFIEHRFYGESMPFGNSSYNSADELGYLTSTQALADYAILISSLKQNLSAEASPVVVFGGSYGGMLASWFRLKYPHVTLGALASSAPILQFDRITPWSSFYDVVSQDYKDESLNCYNVIKASWEMLLDKGSDKKGLLELSRTFRACTEVESVYLIQNWLITAFVDAAMFDYPTPTNFLAPLPAYPVKEMCKIIDGFAADTDVITKVFSAVSLYYNYSGDQKCFQIELGALPHGLEGWHWQACTEMVMPMTASNDSMFPPLSFDYRERSDYCYKKYGVQPRPHWITTEYGGHKIDQVLKRFGSNIIYSNGMRDPWSRGGVLKNISSSIIALVTQKGAHHLDLRSAAKEDPDWLVEQRRQEIEIIRGWIDQYHEDISEASR